MLDESSSGVGDENLPSVRHAGNPGGRINVDADVVLSAENPLPSVKSHPDPEFHTFRPIVFAQVALGGDCSPNGLDGCPKRREEGIPLGPNDVAIVGVDGGPDDLAMSILYCSVSLAQRMKELVDPSMSVNRNVTVPVGGAAICRDRT
jgi:hypothetical protein